MRTVFAWMIALATLAGIGPAAAEYPDRPIRVVVPFAPGGNTDVTARIIADRLRQELGTTVLVENKPGASGMIGMDSVARAAPDGYTLLVSANSMVSVPAIYGNAPYDWKTAFQPISHIQSVPAVLVVTVGSPIKTLADFIKVGPRHTRQDGGRGFGRRHHQSHLPRIDERGDRRQVHAGPLQGQRRRRGRRRGWPGPGPARPGQQRHRLHQGRKLRALAVSSDKRLPELPDVPTMKESGVAGLGDFTFSTYIGLFGPAKMPPEVLAKLHGAMVKVLADPAVVKRFAELSAETRSSTPEELAAMLANEDKTVVPLIKKLGIKPE